MSREWKPGDVALVTFDNASYSQQSKGETAIETLPMLRRDDDWAYPSYGASVMDEMVMEARPLAVIDPEDREQVKRLCDLIPWLGSAPNLVDDMQAALREYAAPKPPKPEEPTGDGAVVEDAHGNRWTRIAGAPPLDPHGARECQSPPWRRRSYAAKWWDDLRAVRVLSEGVATDE